MNQFFQMLKKDHKEVKAILAQLEETTDTQTKKREDLFQKLKEGLIPHMKAEDSVFYPALLANKEARPDALEAVEEHHVSDMVFKELDKAPKGEDQWGAKIAVFKELVEHHIKEEEGTLFKVSEEALEEDEFEIIMKRFEHEKQTVMKNLK